jgi:hypothetical protein
MRDVSKPYYAQHAGYREKDDKPPFFAKDEKERRWMYDWVCSRLDDDAAENFWRGTHLDGLLEEEAREVYERIARWGSRAAALRAAHGGDIEPLKARFPDIAEFISRLPMPHGKHRTKPAARRWPYPPSPEPAEGRRDRIELAVAELAIVRAIWRTYYHRQNRPEQMKAEEIVAERWGVELEEVAERLKRLPAK